MCWLWDVSSELKHKRLPMTKTKCREPHIFDVGNKFNKKKKHFSDIQILFALIHDGARACFAACCLFTDHHMSRLEEIFMPLHQHACRLA